MFRNTKVMKQHFKTKNGVNFIIALKYWIEDLFEYLRSAAAIQTNMKIILQSLFFDAYAKNYFVRSKPFSNPYGVFIYFIYCCFCFEFFNFVSYFFVSVFQSITFYLTLKKVFHKTDIVIKELFHWEHFFTNQLHLKSKRKYIFLRIDFI